MQPVILGLIDFGNKEMVWRGTGTVTLKAKPEKRTQQINKIMAKMRGARQGPDNYWG